VRFAAAALLAFATCNSLRARELRVCWADQTGMSQVTFESFVQELAILLEDTGLQVRWEACAVPPEPNTVRLSVLPSPRATHKSALGVAYVSDSEVLPVIELYLKRLSEYLGWRRSPYVIGRALARVAAHELAHYVLQDPGHESDGLLRPRFPEWMLADPDPAPFRMALRADLFPHAARSSPLIPTGSGSGR